MMSLFAGNEDAHGTHGAPVANAAKGGKMEIKTSAKTLRGGPTLEMWQQHLAGTRPLGVVAILRDGTCHWACIDVDRYDIDPAVVVRDIAKRRLPLVVTRTKSGGVHAFAFLSTPAPAVEVRAAMRDIAAAMGWGDCEVFPKQVEIHSERGDTGNWLNMPYLGGDATERYGVKPTGGAMTLSEFLEVAEAARTGMGALAMPAPRQQRALKKSDDPLADGPPCLQHLSESGFPQGTRNNGLFGLGVYAKKRYQDPAQWAAAIRQFNATLMSPPLPEEEVEGLIQNLARTDYQYKCKDQPCVSFCNSAVCRTRRFGVGGDGLWPEISGLSRLDTDPPLWFVNLEENRIELTTRQLWNYKEFVERVSEVTSRPTLGFLPMKQNDWHTVVCRALEATEIIEVPIAATTKGHFIELLEEFLTNRYRGERREDLHQGKPWLDEEGQRHYFRLRDLMAHLKREQFLAWGRNTVSQRVKDLGGGTTYLNTRTRGVGVWWVPTSLVNAPPVGDLPEPRRDVV